MTRSPLPLFALCLAIAGPALAAEVVPVPEFRSVELDGGGLVSVVPGQTQRVTIIEGSSRYTHIYVDRYRQLRIDNCSVPCPRQYRLRVQVESPQAPALAIKGGGEINAARGFAPAADLAVAVSGGGKIDARSVPAAHVSAAVNGGGELLVFARSSLAAAIRGGGLIRYSGNPAVSQVISGGGAVLRGQ
jgi:hypothetical protein